MEQDSAHRRTRLVRRLSAGLVTSAVVLSGGVAVALSGDDSASGVDVSDGSAGSSGGSDPSSSSSSQVQVDPGSGDSDATTSGS